MYQIFSRLLGQRKVNSLSSIPVRQLITKKKECKYKNKPHTLKFADTYAHHGRVVIPVIQLYFFPSTLKAGIRAQFIAVKRCLGDDA